MRTPLKAWLFAACAIAGFGCTDADKTQVLTGRVTSQDAIAVRAIDGETIITAGRVRSDGSFTLQLPAGHRYRLEVLTTSGVKNVVGAKSGNVADVTFKVCEPTDPFDMGGFGNCDPMDPGSNCYPSCDPMDPASNCAPSCDPMTDPNCTTMPPWPCDPTTDPMCKPDCDPMDPNSGCYPTPCEPGDPNCGGSGGGGGGCGPNDPNCMPPWPCDPTTDPMCKCEPGDPTCGAPCDPMTDPNCPPPPQCDPSDPNCVICPDGTTDPNCKCDWWMGTCEPVPPCDPTVDAMCPTPPPPCEDPTDPNTCKDPCMTDPTNCGCTVAADGTTDPGSGMSCWPQPEPCTMESCPEDPWAPEHPPGDFGCGDGMN